MTHSNQPNLFSISKKETCNQISLFLPRDDASCCIRTSSIQAKTNLALCMIQDKMTDHVKEAQNWTFLQDQADLINIYALHSKHKLQL